MNKQLPRAIDVWNTCSAATCSDILSAISWDEDGLAELLNLREAAMVNPAERYTRLLSF